MTDPLINVIVPIFNRFSFLPRTLLSLQNQSYKNISVICVNDGGENAEKFIENLNDPRFHYYEHEKNLGLPSARNTALKHCDGDYISLLDSDDIYMPFALEFRMYMMKKLSAEIVFTRSLKNIMDHVQYSDGREGYQIVHQELYWNSPFSRDLILVQNVAPCLCPLFSRKAWEDSGPYWFREDLTSTEDHDFWIALSRKNDFVPLELIDSECSFVRNKPENQMTGSRDFSVNWIKVFKAWRHTAEDLNWVTETQNNILRRVGKNPADYDL